VQSKNSQRFTDNGRFRGECNPAYREFIDIFEIYWGIVFGSLSHDEPDLADIYFLR
jgi:hypothetical protein